MLEDVYWICPRCLPLGREPSGFTLLGHYSEESCEVCDETITLCQACVPPDVLPSSRWLNLVTKQASEMFEKEEE